MGEYVMKPLAIRLHDNDNVVTAKSDIDPNISLSEENITTRQFIPVGHKIATKNINKGDDLVKYDNIIGTAKENISVGDHVHVQNTSMSDKKRDYEFSLGCKETQILPKQIKEQLKIFSLNINNCTILKYFIKIISGLENHGTYLRLYFHTHVYMQNMT